MKVQGTGGAAVSRVNDPEFQMFATKSGRDIHDDLERAHRPIESPIKLQPLDPAAERALITESRATSRRTPARVRAPRKPAPPARLPAPRTVKPSTTPPVQRPPVERPPAGGGQTKRATKYDHAALIEMYQAGFTMAEVGRRHGCTGQTVANVLKAAGIPRRPGPGPRPRPPVPAPVVEAEPQVPEFTHAEVLADLADQLQPSLPTTVRRLAQAGFDPTEIAVYCQVDETDVVDVLLQLVRGQVAS